MRYLDSLIKLNLLFALVLSLTACVSDQELIRFESGGNYLSFTNREISAVSLENDAAGKIYANLVLTDQGQELLSVFTNKNINKTMTIIANDKVLLKEIPIRDKITMKSIPFSFESDQETKDFVAKIKSAL